MSGSRKCAAEFCSRSDLLEARFRADDGQWFHNPVKESPDYFMPMLTGDGFHVREL